MMAAFNIESLKDLGYNDTTVFLDPMDPQYRAKSFSNQDLLARGGDFKDDRIAEKCNYFLSLDAYKHAEDAEKALVNYWNTHITGPAAPSTLVTSIVSSSSSVAAATTTPSAASSAAITPV